MEIGFILTATSESGEAVIKEYFLRKKKATDKLIFKETLISKEPYTLKVLYKRVAAKRIIKLPDLIIRDSIIRALKYVDPLLVIGEDVEIEIIRGIYEYD